MNSKSRSLILPALIVLLGAALRLVALERLPPGLFYDESANGVDALRVLAGAHPVFFAGNQGREPMLIYLQAATMALIGPSPLALRLPSAAAGILTVAASFAAFRAFFGRTVGLLAAFLVAASFWDVSLSRLAFRAGLLPLFATLAAFWLWKGARTGQLRSFAIGGVLLGADLYTYIPARLAPLLFGLWFLGFLLIPAWRKGISRGRLIAGGLIAAALFILTFAPLASYFAAHPGEFLGRIQAEAGGVPGAGPLAGVEKAAQALVWSGDPNPRQDLPGRALLDPPVALAAALGVVVALRRWRDGASIFVLGWCCAMLLPAALSREPAHALRLVGELPFVLALAALGLGYLVQNQGAFSVFPPRRPAPSPPDAEMQRCGDAASPRTYSPRRPFSVSRRWAGLAIVGVVCVGVLVFNVRDYFVVWAANQSTEQAFQSDALRAPALLELVPNGAPAFATADFYEGTPIPLSFLPRLAARARAFDGRDTFVTPAARGTPVYYAYASSFVPAGGIPAAEHLRLVATSRDSLGQVDGKLFREDPPLVPPEPSRPASAVIASAARITGVDLQPVVQPGGSVHFALYWTVVGQPPPGNWIFFAHLVGQPSQRLLGQDYNQGFPPNQWRIGDRVVTTFNIPTTSDAPATVANVEAGLFDPTTGQRLPVTDPRGKPAGTAYSAGPVRIDRPGPVPAATHPLAARFGPSIRLLGYDLTQDGSGEIDLRLHWVADRPVDRDYTVFVHLMDASGKVIADADSQPGSRAFPTSTWRVGEEILDEHRIQRPPGGAGDHLEIGMYLLSTGQRLPVSGAGRSSPGDALEIPL